MRSNDRIQEHLRTIVNPLQDGKYSAAKIRVNVLHLVRMSNAETLQRKDRRPLPALRTGDGGERNAGGSGGCAQAGQQRSTVHIVKEAPFQKCEVWISPALDCTLIRPFFNEVLGQPTPNFIDQYLQDRYL